jgi:ATP-dependent protease ClpP protease subunit
MAEKSENEIVSGANVLAFTEKPISKVHKFYLVDEIKQPSEYTQWFETIRSAGENDVVIFHINSPGGLLHTTVQFIRVMTESKATIIASVEGICMSAATLIFLAAKHWEISKYSTFMFHDYSNYAGGKGGELFDYITHERKWADKWMRDSYSGFLTEAELSSMLHGKDIWLSGDDVTKRLIARAAKTLKGAKVIKPKKSVKSTKKPAKPLKKAPTKKS